LVLILFVTALKEAIEDWARYKMDKEINNKVVRVWNKSRNEFVNVTWQHVSVGDILYVRDGEAFPADLAILKASTQQGSCTIETSNLDGETNLKVKQAIPETYNIPCAADGSDFPSRLPNCVIESSAPNKKLDTGSWKANVAFARNGIGSGEKLPLGVAQLLLRGCTLRNTRWVIGFVVFTGKDTKLMLNNKPPVFKRSSIERMVDKSLYVLFTLQACLCSFGAVANYLWLDSNRLKHWYLPYIQPANSESYSTEAGLSWFTYLVLLDILIPISLYVSMELVKFAQAFYINRDLDMYYGTHRYSHSTLTCMHDPSRLLINCLSNNRII
jgi:phospholipid-transporting ATPase